MKKAICVGLLVLFFIAAFGGCKGLPFLPGGEDEGEPPAPEPPAPETTAVNEPPPSPRPSMAFISMGLPEQYRQSVEEGAQSFADEYEVLLTFNSLPADANHAAQAGALDNALEAGVSALCLSGLDGAAISGQLRRAGDEKIPVVSFADGVADAPTGTIASFSRADGYAAGRLAAESMFSSYALLERVRNATAASPVIIAIGQEGANGREQDRIRGFLDKMEELVGTANPLGARITGDDRFASPADGAAVELDVTEAHEAADMLENAGNLIGYLCVGESEAEILLDATSGGADLDRANGRYKDLAVVGFDAGERQKNAVRSRGFYGAVADDTFNMGYVATELAYTVLQAEAVPEETDTGCRFYSFENMDSPSVAPLLYD